MIARRIALVVAVATAAGALLATPPTAVAHPALAHAPVNPEFRAWRKQALDPLASSSARLGAPARSLGYVPSPVGPPGVGAYTLPLGSGTYDASFDLRTQGRVSPVENQGGFGVCWAFAAVASLESSFLPANPYDFSEDNLALNTGFDGAPYSGGNSTMSTAYFARWTGPVWATDDAYGDGITPAGLSAVKHVQDVLFLPARATALDNDAIKWALTTYGGVATAMRVENSGWKSSLAGTTYYWSGGGATNHLVTIVGWDDSYSKDNFATKPPYDGAFIVKNSWGAGWGDGGYFYLSYCDTLAGLYNAVFLGQDLGAYDHVYQYDTLGETYSWGYTGNGRTNWMANRFTSGGGEDLTAVGLYTLASDESYQIYFGTSLTSPATLVASGTVAVPGYHTIDLTTTEPLASGETFYVIARVVTPGTDYGIPLEWAWTGYSSQAVSHSGESYISWNGASWSDFGDPANSNHGNVCLKAFTVVTGAGSDVTPPTTLTTGLVSGWSRGPVTVTFTAADEPGGSGVAYVEYRLNGALPRVRAGAVTIGAQGDTTLAYRSADLAGNVEAEHAAHVRIDSRRPVTKAPRAAHVVHGRIATLKYRVVDAMPGCGAATGIMIRIKSPAGRVVKTVRVRGVKAVNKTLRASFRCRLAAGTYRFFVYGADLAGNTQSTLGSNRLVVD